MFCLVPFTKSDMVFLCLRTNVSVQTDFSLCRATCHNHATKEKNTIHIVFREGEHGVETWVNLFCPGGGKVDIKQCFPVTFSFHIFSIIYSILNKITTVGSEF